MSDYSYTLNAFGLTLKISGDCDSCLKDICSWYAMPPVEESREADMSLHICGADINQMESRLPLPRDEYKIRSGVITGHQNFDFAYYKDGNRYWADYAGAGRLMIDFSRCCAEVLIYSKTMLPTYQIILFADHALGKLFASKGIFSMHASCAAIGGKGIAFTGTSGAGKSTAAFALARAGMPVLTDERLFVTKDAGYQARSISDIIKVREDVMSRFFAGADSCRTYDVIGDEHYLKLGSSKTIAWRDSAPLKALCLLEQTGQPETKIMPVSPLKLTGGLFPVTMTSSYSRFRAAKFEFVMEMMDNVECRLVKFGTDMNDFAAKIRQLAESL